MGKPHLLDRLSHGLTHCRQAGSPARAEASRGSDIAVSYSKSYVIYVICQQTGTTKKWRVQINPHPLVLDRSTERLLD